MIKYSAANPRSAPCGPMLSRLSLVLFLLLSFALYPYHYYDHRYYVVLSARFSLAYVTSIKTGG